METNIFEEVLADVSKWNNGTISFSQLVAKSWKYAFEDLGDKRTRRWPMMADPIPTFTLIGIYLLFIHIIGPKLMENRKPFELKNVLVAYNFVQVCVSFWIVKESVELYTNKYSLFTCESVEVDTSIESIRICWGFYVYYLAKLSELLDTVFFVLRKKYRQITFLHLYHHTGMAVMSWFTVKYFPGGHAAFLGFINSFVHVVMYLYYMLAAMGPEVQKHLWWKRWITILQLIQFALGFIHFTQVLNSDCNYPKWTIVIVFPNAIFFYYLFWDFYRKAYQNKESRFGVNSPIIGTTILASYGDNTEGRQIRKRNKETGVHE